MQSLLLDRALKKISPLEFSTTVTESFYSILKQNALQNVFPNNCHSNAAVNSLSLESIDYQYLISGCADSSIKLWDLNSQDEVEENRDDYNDNPMRWKSKRQFDDYDYDNPKQTFSNIATIPRKSAHSFGVSSIQWWPFDTGMFVSASFDHMVKIWDTNELTAVHQFDLNNRIYSIDICGQSLNTRTASALVAVASDQPFIRLLDLRSTSSAHTLSGHKGKTLSIKWHPTNSSLLASGGFDGEVKIWDIRRSKSCLCRLDMLKTNSTPLSLDSDNLTNTSVKAHLGPVNGLVWDESGTTLFTAGNDDKVRVWDMTASMPPPINKLINFGPLTRNKYPQTIPIILNPKRESELQYLLFPSDSGDVFVYRTIDGKLVSRLSRRGSKNSGRTASMVSAAPFSGTYFCGTMDGEIISWSPSWAVPDIEGNEFESKTSIEYDTERKDQMMKEAKEMMYNDPYFKFQAQDSL